MTGLPRPMTLEDLIAETVAKFDAYKAKKDSEDAAREEALKNSVIALRDRIPPLPFAASDN